MLRSPSASLVVSAASAQSFVDVAAVVFQWLQSFVAKFLLFAIVCRCLARLCCFAAAWSSCLLVLHDTLCPQHDPLTQFLLCRFHNGLDGHVVRRQLADLPFPLSRGELCFGACSGYNRLLHWRQSFDALLLFACFQFLLLNWIVFTLCGFSRPVLIELLAVLNAETLLQVAVETSTCTRGIWSS